MPRLRSSVGMDVRDQRDRPVHGRPRQPRRDHRPARDPRRPRRLAPAARVDGQRLHADVRRAAAHRRRARRPVRPSPDVRHRPRSSSPPARSRPPSRPNSDVLILARAIQGVGGAIVTPLSLTILSAAVPPERRALALGAWGGIAGLAIAIGPLVGGAIAQGAELALDLLAQRAGRHRRDGPRLPAARGDATDPRAGSTSRASASRARACWARVGRDQRQRPRLDRSRDRRGHRRRRPAPGRLRGLGGARQEPDAADGHVPQPGVRGRQQRRRC